jgi:hypothetical protein
MLRPKHPIGESPVAYPAGSPPDVPKECGTALDIRPSRSDDSARASRASGSVSVSDEVIGTSGRTGCAAATLDAVAIVNVAARPIARTSSAYRRRATLPFGRG